MAVRSCLARQDLDHEAVGTACDQVVDLQAPFPPGKEILDIPSQLVCLGDLFTGKLVAVGCNPVLDKLVESAGKSRQGVRGASPPHGKG